MPSAKSADMRSATLRLAVAVLSSAWLIRAEPVRARRTSAERHPVAAKGCHDIMGFQVLLDRQGFSPGEIDGRLGANSLHALAAFQEAARLPVKRTLDCATRDALTRTGGDSTTVPYEIG